MTPKTMGKIFITPLQCLRHNMMSQLPEWELAQAIPKSSLLIYTYVGSDIRLKIISETDPRIGPHKVKIQFVYNNWTIGEIGNMINKLMRVMEKRR